MGRALEKLKELDAKTVRIGLVVVVIVTIALVAILSGGSGDGSDSSSAESAEAPLALSESELLTRAGSLPHPVYWVGPRPGTESYELTTKADGQVYLRYLTDGAQAGDPRADFVTVGTYSVPDATGALDTAKASNPEAKLIKRSGYELLDPGSGTNAYVVFDNQPELQVEIFSPNPGEALILAKSGALKPVG